MGMISLSLKMQIVQGFTVEKSGDALNFPEV
jgi:hypothetical protein